MSWAVGYDEHWQRWIGYGVSAYCDQPGCDKEIDRGLSYVCGGEPYGGERGCGLYFCEEHHRFIGQLCKRCATHKSPYKRIKPEHPEWLHHQQTDESWAEWRREQSALLPAEQKEETPLMGDRYQVGRNNNDVYPFVVVDTQEGIPVAFTVTKHTAYQYARQMNEDGIHFRSLR